MRYFIIVLFASLSSACFVVNQPTGSGGSGGSAGADTGGGGSGGTGGTGGAVACDDMNPCTSDAIGDNGCVFTKLPDDTICDGAATDPVHGECSNGVCYVIDWTCLHGSAGDECGVGGKCALDANGDPICCHDDDFNQRCVDPSTGLCRVSNDAHCGHDGSACMTCQASACSNGVCSP